MKKMSKGLLTAAVLVALSLIGTDVCEARKVIDVADLKIELVNNTMSEEDAQRLLELGIFHYKQEYYYKAREIFHSITEYFSGELIDDALYWRGRASFLYSWDERTKDWREANGLAYDSLVSLVKLFPESNVIKEGELRKTLTEIIKRFTNCPPKKMKPGEPPRDYKCNVEEAIGYYVLFEEFETDESILNSSKDRIRKAATEMIKCLTYLPQGGVGLDLDKTCIGYDYADIPEAIRYYGLLKTFETDAVVLQNSRSRIEQVLNSEFIFTVTISSSHRLSDTNARSILSKMSWEAFEEVSYDIYYDFLSDYGASGLDDFRGRWRNRPLHLFPNIIEYHYPKKGEKEKIWRTIKYTSVQEMLDNSEKNASKPWINVMDYMSCTYTYSVIPKELYSWLDIDPYSIIQYRDMDRDVEGEGL